MTRKIGLWIAGAWILFLIVAVIYFSFSKTNENQPAQEDPVVSNPSVADLLEGAAAEGVQIDVEHILGNWISDRTDQNMMTLNADNTFVDTNLMGKGTFEIRGSYLILTSASGDEYVMLYREDMDEFYYTIDKYVSVYHRATEEEIAEKTAKIEHRLSEQAEQEAEWLKEAREKLVNTSWGSGTDYIAFKLHSFVRHKGDMEQEFNFDITSASYIEGYPAGYNLELAVTDENGDPQECEFFMLLLGNEELPPSIELSLNGETITLPDAYQSGGEIDWGDSETVADFRSEIPIDQIEPVEDQNVLTDGEDR